MFIGKATHDRLPVVVADGVTVEQGQLVYGDAATGHVTDEPNEFPVGFATEDIVGDGETEYDVQLPEEITTYTFPQNTASPVALRFTSANIAADGSVTAGAGTRIGRVWVIEPSGVRVQIVREV